jgi:hypothetical protein
MLLGMSGATVEIIRLCEALPEDKRAEVLDFARFLLQQAEHPDDAAWEARLNEPKRRPRLEAFIEQSTAEGGEETLDLNRL